MRHGIKLRLGFVAMVAVVFSVLMPVVPVQASIIHESATFGPVTSGHTSPLIDSTQFLGSRFSLSQTVNVENVGGHLFQTTGMLFAAIVSLPSDTALPTGDPLDLELAGELLAQTTFMVPGPAAADYFFPLPVTLIPGDYGLIFGSGLFGTTGTGVMANTNNDIGSASYFFSTGNTGNIWADGGSNLRFVVTGAPIPEPSTMLLSSLGFLAIGLYVWRRERTQLS